MKVFNYKLVILFLGIIASINRCLAHDSTFVKLTVTDSLLLYGSPFLTAEGFTSFHTAIDSANSQERTLVVSREVSLSTQDTIRSNLIIRQGGLITGHNLVVEGDLLAGPYQIVGDGATIQLQNSKVSHGYIEWWGAKGDSTTDDRQAFVEALIYMDGKEIRLLSGKNYLFQNTERKDIDGRDVRVTTTGATRASIFFADTSDAFRISGIRKDTVTIDGALASGTDTLLVDDASNIRVGYLIELRSNKAWYYDDAKLQPKGELHYVRKVSSDTVWTRHVTFDSYSASEDVDVIVYEPITVQIAGVNFIYPLNDDQANGIALEARYWGPGSRITNCSIQESDLTGLQLTSCFNIRIDNSDIVGCDKQGNGYGIHDQGGYGSIIENNYFYGNRSGIDAGNYMSRSNKFTNNIVNASNLENDSTRALGLHQLAEGWLIEGNVIESAYYGIIDRGVNNVIKGNKFHSIGAVVISKNGGGSFTVMDNIYNSQLDKREDVGPSVWKLNKRIRLLQLLETLI